MTDDKGRKLGMTEAELDRLVLGDEYADVPEQPEVAEKTAGTRNALVGLLAIGATVLPGIAIAGDRLVVLEGDRVEVYDDAQEMDGEVEPSENVVYLPDYGYGMTVTSNGFASVVSDPATVDASIHTVDLDALSVSGTQPITGAGVPSLRFGDDTFWLPADESTNLMNPENPTSITTPIERLLAPVGDIVNSGGERVVVGGTAEGGLCVSHETAARSESYEEVFLLSSMEQFAEVVPGLSGINVYGISGINVKPDRLELNVGTEDGTVMVVCPFNPDDPGGLDLSQASIVVEGPYGLGGIYSTENYYVGVGTDGVRFSERNNPSNARYIEFPLGTDAGRTFFNPYTQELYVFGGLGIAVFDLSNPDINSVPSEPARIIDVPGSVDDFSVLFGRSDDNEIPEGLEDPANLVPNSTPPMYIDAPSGMEVIADGDTLNVTIPVEAIADLEDGEEFSLAFVTQVTQDGPQNHTVVVGISDPNETILGSFSLAMGGCGGEVGVKRSGDFSVGFGRAFEDGDGHKARYTIGDGNETETYSEGGSVDSGSVTVDSPDGKPVELFESTGDDDEVDDDDTGNDQTPGETPPPGETSPDNCGDCAVVKPGSPAAFVLAPMAALAGIGRRRRSKDAA